MKKNVMMRLASFLLVAVLISTSAISGTYAKYVTKAESTDTARVAKWGVEVTSTSDMFNTTYATDDTTVTGINNSVETAPTGDGKELVAPGTTKEDVAFTITGTPEVAVNVSVKIDPLGTNTEVKDVYLKKGTYTDYTKSVLGTDGNPKYETFELTEDYYPLKWTLKNGTKIVAEGKLSDIETYLEGTNVSNNYAPNTDLSKIDAATDGTGDYTLSWTWDFERKDGEGKVIDKFDAADTLLGNLAAGKATVDSSKYCLDVQYELSIAVTQID